MVVDIKYRVFDFILKEGSIYKDRALTEDDINIVVAREFLVSL
jgi:hypothetical protein